MVETSQLQNSCLLSLLGWFLGRFGWRGCHHRHLSAYPHPHPPTAAAVVCLSSSPPANVAIFNFTFFGCPIFHTFELAFPNITRLFRSRGKKNTPHIRDTCKLLTHFCYSRSNLLERGRHREKTQRCCGQKIPFGAGAACSCLMLNRALAFYLIPPLSDATLSAVLTTSDLILLYRCQQNVIM